jgi:hypothetical protein
MHRPKQERHQEPMTRRCGDTLQWRRRTREVERVCACTRAFESDVGKPQGRAHLNKLRQRRRGRAQPIRPYDTWLPPKFRRTTREDPSTLVTGHPEPQRRVSSLEAMKLDE